MSPCHQPKFVLGISFSTEEAKKKLLDTVKDEIIEVIKDVLK